MQRTSRDDRSCPAESSPDIQAAAAAPGAWPLEGAGEPEALDLVRDGEGDRPVDPRGPEVVGREVPGGDLRVLSDQAWEWMQPLLPTSTGRRGGRWRDHRQVVDAICWKYRTGSAWRELPARFGPWQTAYHRAARWSGNGTWARLLAQAQTCTDAEGELDWLAVVGSPGLRVARHGASAPRVGGTAPTASADEPEEGAAA